MRAEIVEYEMDGGRIGICLGQAVEDESKLFSRIDSVWAK